MRVTKTVMKEVEITLDAICNKCGETCMPPASRIAHEAFTPVKWEPGVGLVDISEEEATDLHEPDLYGLIEATVGGGYSSYALEDMCSYTFSLCEGCLKVMFDGFKIPVLRIDRLE